MVEREWREPSEPLYPIALPPELGEFLRRQGAFACVTMPTTLGTSYVLKAPAQDIDSARGTTPIHIQHLLYAHRNAPVIRTLLTIYDQPEHPLRVESFINVADPGQRADFAALAEQKHYILLFYDEALRHRLSKLVPNSQDGVEASIIEQADQALTRIPVWRHNYDQAKADIMRRTSL
jgi:hypothetical protein